MIIVPSCRDRKGHPCLFLVETAKEVFPGKNLGEIMAADPFRIEYVGVGEGMSLIRIQKKTTGR